ncbi:DUF3098 domain-containing protein [Viscerimonas tarda]
MDKKEYAFGKKNYIICAVSVLIVIIGFLLMTGSASTIEEGFQADIFSTRRTVVAPMVCFSGFLLMIVGILFQGKPNETDK